MKRLILLFTVFIVFSCGSDTMEKPDPLLKEEQMVDILYDLALLQAYKSANPKALSENKVDPEKYIYKKYAMDSLVFAKNHAWYASDLENYKKIQDKIAERLSRNKQKYASSVNDPAQAKPKSDAVRKRDSLRRVLSGVPQRQ